MSRPPPIWEFITLQLEQLDKPAGTILEIPLENAGEWLPLLKRMFHVDRSAEASRPGMVAFHIAGHGVPAAARAQLWFENRDVEGKPAVVFSFQEVAA